MGLREILAGLGGRETDETFNSSEAPYYDKANHLARSVVHQPNHLPHAKQILGPELCRPSDDGSKRRHDWMVLHMPIKRSRNQK